MLGAAISTAGLAALAANRALAHGPFTAANPTSFSSNAAPAASDPRPASVPQPTVSIVKFDRRERLGDDASPHDRHRREAAGRRREEGRFTLLRRRTKLSASIQLAGGGAKPAYVGSQPMCVRLCDGFFFPLPVATGDAAQQAASCNSLCPDAPTEVYYRNGSERIEDSISASGKPYTALPVSLRYRGATDNTCACHRDVVAYAPLRDWTLRRGDAIMTPAGMIVFKGAEGPTHTAAEFTALGAASLPRAQRGELQAMERVSLDKKRPTLRDWLVSQGAPAVEVAARAPRKGNGKIRLLVWRGAED